MPETLVFDETFMRKLEQLSLVVRRVRSGHFKGDRRSSKRGQSIEFADYRNYVQGDDLRALDWNIYARLERPFIKLFEEEIDQTVHILLDASGSMDWPQNLPQAERQTHKWTYARQLGTALAYIGLAANDRVLLTCLHENSFELWGPERQRRRVHHLLNFLGDYPAAGQLAFKAVLTRYAKQNKRPGLLFVVSDFLSTEDYQAGLSTLQAQGHEVSVIHLLAPDEIDPTLAGDFELYDVETGANQDITVNGSLRALYQEKFAAWQGDIASFCQRRNIAYALVSTAEPVESLMLQHLRRRGLVR